MLLTLTSPAVAIPPGSHLSATQAKIQNPAAFFYSLQIDQGSDFAELEKKADYIAQILPLRVRIVKVGDGYAVRCGKPLQANEFEAHLATLKAVGIPDAEIIYVQAGQEDVVKTVNPDAPEFADQAKDQKHLLHAQQEKGQDATRRMSEIYPGDTEFSRLQRLNKQMDREIQANSGTLVRDAWEAYRHGSLETACELFERAQTQPETKQEGSWGLAHCFLQRSKYKEAIALLAELLQKGVKPEETRPLLMEALLKAGEYDAALEEAHFLRDGQAQQWIALIAKTKKTDGLALARNRYNPENPKAFIDENRAFLDQCLLPDIFITVAWDLLKAKNKAATPVFERLFNVCDGQWETKLSAYTGLAQLMPPEMLLPIIDRELALKNLPPGYSRKLLASKIDILHRITASLDEGSPEEADKAETLYREILALNPEDKDAQIFVAWRRFSQEDYPAAHEYFLAIYRRYPHDKGVVEGLAYTLARLGKLDEAIAMAEATGDVKLKINFLREKLIKCPPDSKEAVELSQRILALDPDDKTALNALAWSHYHHEEYGRGLELFRRLSHADPENSDFRSGLINGLSKLNRFDEAFSELQRAGRRDAAYQKLEASLYMARANHYFQDKKYKESEADLKKVLEFSPNDPDARLLIGWSLYFEKETKAAMDYFLGIWQERQDAGVASVLPGLYDEFGMSEEKAAFLGELAQSGKPESHKILADYYAGQGRNIQAAETFDAPQSPYFNVHRPSLALDYLYRSRSGDGGTARLEQQGARLTYKHPLGACPRIEHSRKPY